MVPNKSAQYFYFGKIPPPLIATTYSLAGFTKKFPAQGVFRNSLNHFWKIPEKLSEF